MDIDGVRARPWIVSVDPGRTAMGVVALSADDREVIAHATIPCRRHTVAAMCDAVHELMLFIERTNATLVQYAPYALMRIVVEHNTMSAPLYALMMSVVAMDQVLTTGAVAMAPSSAVIHPVDVDRHFDITVSADVTGRARYDRNKVNSVAKARALGYTADEAPTTDVCEALLQALYYIDTFLTVQ